MIDIYKNIIKKVYLFILLALLNIRQFIIIKIMNKDNTSYRWYKLHIPTPQTPEDIIDNYDGRVVSLMADGVVTLMKPVDTTPFGVIVKKSVSTKNYRESIDVITGKTVRDYDPIVYLALFSQSGIAKVRSKGPVTEGDIMAFHSEGIVCPKEDALTETPVIIGKALTKLTKDNGYVYVAFKAQKE